MTVERPGTREPNEAARVVWRALTGEYPPGPLYRPVPSGAVGLLVLLLVATVAIPGPYLLLSIADVPVTGDMVWFIVPSMWGLAQVLCSACLQRLNMHAGHLLPREAAGGESWVYRRRPVRCDGLDGRYELTWRPWAVVFSVLAFTGLVAWRVFGSWRGSAADGALPSLTVLTLAAGLGTFCLARRTSSLVLRARVVPLSRYRDEGNVR